MTPPMPPLLVAPLVYTGPRRTVRGGLRAPGRESRPEGSGDETEDEDHGVVETDATTLASPVTG